MATLPKIDEVRSTTLHKRPVKEQELKTFYKGLKEKILACAAKAIQNGTYLGKYTATVGYYSKEHGLIKKTRKTGVRTVWRECVEDLKRDGYDASLDINTFKTEGNNMFGEHKGYFQIISIVLAKKNKK